MSMSPNGPELIFSLPLAKVREYQPKLSSIIPIQPCMTTFLMPIINGGGLLVHTSAVMTYVMLIAKRESCQPTLGSIIPNGPKQLLSCPFVRGASRYPGQWLQMVPNDFFFN